MINHVQFPQLGLELTVNRVAFTAFGVNIYWYGVCIALGLALGAVFAIRKARSFGVNEDRLIDVIMLSTICSIIGARAYYVAFAPFKYNSFAEMINLRDGGVAIYGSVIAAFLSGWLFCKLRKIPVLASFDLTAMGFLIGQGIGRWGNFFNQEAFGTNTTLPWGMYSEGTQSYLAGVKDTLAASGITVDPSLPVHPTFLYESLWCLLGFVLLLVYLKHRRFNGEILLLYIIWYGAERAVVEGLRTDSLETFMGVRVSQLVAIVSVGVGLLVWGLLRKKYAGKPLMVTYDFPVNPKEKNSPVMTMTWKASEAMPTQTEVEAAYAAQQAEKEQADADVAPAEAAPEEAAPTEAAPEKKATTEAEPEETPVESAAEKAAEETTGEADCEKTEQQEAAEETKLPENAETK